MASLYQTSWVKNLSKPSLLQILAEMGISAESTQSIDALRQLMLERVVAKEKVVSADGSSVQRPVVSVTEILGESSPILSTIKKLPDCLSQRIPTLESLTFSSVLKYLIQLMKILELPLTNQQTIYAVSIFKVPNTLQNVFAKAMEENICPSDLCKGVLNHLFSQLTQQKERMKLLSLSQRPNESMSDYVKSVLDKVHVLGLPCEEDYFTKLIFHSLLSTNAKFFMFVSLPKTLAELFKLVSEVELTIRDTVSPSVNWEEYQSKPKIARDERKQKGACVSEERARDVSFSQGPSAHTKDQSMQTETVNHRFVRKPIVCWLCSNEGHVRSKCPNKRPPSGIQIVKNGGCLMLSGLVYAPVQIGACNVDALVDSGASCSLISQDFCNNLLRNSNKGEVVVKPGSQLSFSLADGGLLDSVCAAEVKLKINKFSWKFTFRVIANLAHPVILGIDFLRKSKALLKVDENKLIFEFCPEQPVVLRSVDSNVTCRRTCTLSIDQAASLEKLKREFDDVVTDRIGHCTMCPVKLSLKDHIPVSSRPYSMAPPKLEKMRSMVNQMLVDGVIEPSFSSYSNPAFLIPKRKEGDYRFLVDFRKVNQKIFVDPYPIPTVDSVFQHVNEANYFSVLDLNSAFHQVEVDKDSRDPLSFCTPWGLYRFCRLPMGVNVGPQSMSRVLHQVLGEHLFKFVFVYIDDVCIYSRTFEEHLNHLRVVLEALRKAGITVNPEKVSWAVNHVRYLGFIISQGKLLVDPEKICPVVEFPRPKNVKGVRRFLGMSGFYAKFIKNYADVAEPLNRLKRKGTDFVWGPEQDQAFESLKDKLTSAPVLHLPNFDADFIVHADASALAVGGVLSQEINGDLVPVAYFSKLLTPAEQKYSSYEKECFACITAMEKFSDYLELKPFKLYTDNQALSWLLKTNKPIGRLARWLVRLSRFSYTVCHIKGSDNKVADCLSRSYDADEFVVPDSSEQVNVLQHFPLAFKDIKEHQLSDDECSQIRQEIASGTSNYILKNDLVGVRDRKGLFKVFVPCFVRPMVFEYFHSSVFGGHLGREKTKAKIKSLFFWPSLNQDIDNLVRSCTVCQRSKPLNAKPVGTYSASPAAFPWERVYLDIFGPIPRSKGGFTAILVGVDSFSKYVFLFPLRTLKASEIVRVLTFGLFSICGAPIELVTDNATNFVGHEFRSMCFSWGIKAIQTSPYTPQSNLTERYNRNIKTALRCFLTKDHKSWDELLPLLSLSFNNVPSEATKFTPAQVFFGRDLFHPLLNAWSLHPVIMERTESSQLLDVWESVVKNLSDYHSKLKDRYNNVHEPHNFSVGQRVWTRSHFLSAKVEDFSSKLAPKFVGPYTIVRFLSPVTVLLEDPSVPGKMFKCHVRDLKACL